MLVRRNRLLDDRRSHSRTANGSRLVAFDGLWGDAGSERDLIRLLGVVEVGRTDVTSPTTSGRGEKGVNVIRGTKSGAEVATSSARCCFGIRSDQVGIKVFLFEDYRSCLTRDFKWPMSLVDS